MKRKGENRQLRREEVEAEYEREDEEEETVEIGNFPRADEETIKQRKKLKIIRPQKIVHNTNQNETLAPNPFSLISLVKATKVDQQSTNPATQENVNKTVTEEAGNQESHEKNANESDKTNVHEEQPKESQKTDEKPVINEKETNIGVDNNSSELSEETQTTEKQNKNEEVNENEKKEDDDENEKKEDDDENEKKEDDKNEQQSNEDSEKKTETAPVTSKPLFSFTGSSTIPKFTFSGFSKASTNPFSTTSTPVTFSSLAPTKSALKFPFTNAAPELKFPSSTAENNNKTNDNEDGDGSDYPVLEPKANVKKAEYPDEDILYEVHAKLQKFREEKEKEGAGQWIDLGTGSFCILKHKTNEKTRLVMRNQIGKVILNSYMFPNMFFNKQKNGVMFICNTGEIEKVFLRVKSTEFTNLVQNLETNIPK